MKRRGRQTHTHTHTYSNVWHHKMIIMEQQQKSTVFELYAPLSSSTHIPLLSELTTAGCRCRCCELGLVDKTDNHHHHHPDGLGPDGCISDVSSFNCCFRIQNRTRNKWKKPYLFFPFSICCHCLAVRSSVTILFIPKFPPKRSHAIIIESSDSPCHWKLISSLITDTKIDSLI